MAQPQGQEGHDDALYIIGALMVLWILASVFLGDYVAAAEVWLLRFWVEAARLVWHSPRLDAIHVTFLAYAPSEWNSARISALSSLVRWWACPIMGGILAWYAWNAIRKNPAKRHRRIFDMHRLAASQAVLWPWISPALNLDVLNEPLDTGKYRMALTELEFVRRYRLLETEDQLTLNEMKTERLFATQLGRLWEGPGRLHRHERALFACFAAQICGDRDGCLDGLRALTVGYATTGQVDSQPVAALLEKYADDARVSAVVMQHAYVSTVLCGVLESARRFGKIPPVFFLWLRLYDRPLWYALQRVGSNTPFPEAAGVYSHYIAEKVAEHAIEVPFVKPAMLALVKELKTVKLPRKPQTFSY